MGFPEGIQKADCFPFIEFMLSVIHMAITDAATPQVRPQVTPRVKQLLHALKGEMTREELQKALGLADRKSFRERYLAPALSGGYIEMTLPDKPNSRFQRYRLTSNA